MEQKVFSKFNVYDQIGYLMVGAVSLLILAFNIVYFFQIPIPPFSLDTFSIWFIVAYFAGHFVQGVTNLINEIKFLHFLIPENKEDFDDKQKEILYQAKEYFGLQKQDNSRLWSLCYMLASGKDITGQVQEFNSYYSLYRGWLILFVLESLFLMYFVFFAYNINTLLSFLFSIISAFIFYRRSKRFWRYIRNKVLETFVIVKTLNL